MNLKVTKSKHPAQQSASKLESLLREAAPNTVLLMLSGGSAFELLRYIAVKNFDPVTISVLDERYSEDESSNNFAQLMHTEFYKKAEAAGASFIDTRITKGESFNDAEVRFDYAVKNWIHDNPGGTIIATMGIGPDGHTAGIFPHEDDEKFRFLFEQDERYVVGYNTSVNQFHERLTVTNHFLREHVDHVVVFAVGEAKRSALEKLLAPERTLSEAPARIIHEMKDAELFTDLAL